jgi:hypothetical protein
MPECCSTACTCIPVGSFTLGTDGSCPCAEMECRYVLIFKPSCEKSAWYICGQ